MSLVASLFAPTRPRASMDSIRELFLGESSGVALSGIHVTPSTALKLAAVWACVRVISDPLAAVPLILYRRQADGGRTRGRNNPLYDVLHSTPNNWQTSLGFRKQLTVFALTRGEGIAQILPGPRGAVDRLIPIHPDRIVDAWQTDDYSLRYQVLGLNGKTQTLLPDEVFQVAGLSLDGIRGTSVLAYARESIGLGLAADEYGARYFSQNATPVAVLKHPGRLTDKARARIRDEWEANTSGLHNAHRTAVIMEGMDYQAVGANNRDAQLLELRSFQVEDVARWFGVPLHMIQSTTKETSWGSGIEQMWLGFITTTLLFWAQAWEQAITRDLIIDTNNYYAEFLLDALARGTMYERYQAYHLGITDGHLNANEVRELENRNRVPGLDAYLMPANMLERGQTSAAPSAAPAPEPAPGPIPAGGQGTSGDSSVELRYRRLLASVAQRATRKEQAAMQRAARRCAGDAATWKQAVEDFYADHAFYVAEALHLPAERANDYADEQRRRLLATGPELSEGWAAERAGELMRLALQAGGMD